MQPKKSQYRINPQINEAFCQPLAYFNYFDYFRGYLIALASKPFQLFKSENRGTQSPSAVPQPATVKKGPAQNSIAPRSPDSQTVIKNSQPQSPQSTPSTNYNVTCPPGQVALFEGGIFSGCETPAQADQ